MKNYNNVLEVIDEQVALRKGAISIVNLAEAEKRELTDEEQKEYDEIKTKIQELEAVKAELEAKLNEEPAEEIKSEEEPVEEIKENKEDKRYMNKFIQSVREGKREFNCELRDINTSATTGGEGVSTNATLVDALRNKLVLAQAGATILDGLKGNERFAIYAGATASWSTSENQTVTDGSGAFTSVDLTPKRLAVVCNISNRWLQQTEDGEKFIMNDIVNAISEKLESTVLGSGAGSTTTPAGLFNAVTASTTVTTKDDIFGLEAEVEKAKVTPNAYILSPAAKAFFRGIDASKNLSLYNNGDVDGLPAYTTGNAVDKGVLVGDFSNLCIGMWNDVHVVVDPYTLAAADMTRFIINLSIDAVVRHSGAIKGYICKVK